MATWGLRRKPSARELQRETFRERSQQKTASQGSARVLARILGWQCQRVICSLVITFQPPPRNSAVGAFFFLLLFSGIVFRMSVEGRRYCWQMTQLFQYGAQKRTLRSNCVAASSRADDEGGESGIGRAFSWEPLRNRCQLPWQQQTDARRRSYRLI